jgi:hypothetical protein
LFDWLCHWVAHPQARDTQSIQSSYGSLGNGPGQFNWPQVTAVDSLGRVLVSDRDNQRLVVLSFEWTNFVYQGSYTAGFELPYGIAVDK